MREISRNVIKNLIIDSVDLDPEFYNEAKCLYLNLIHNDRTNPIDHFKEDFRDLVWNYFIENIDLDTAVYRVIEQEGVCG